MIEEKLKILEKVLADKHPRLMPNLLPPIMEKDEMESAFSEITKNYFLPADIICLYSWKSGTAIKYQKMEHYNEIHSDSFIIPGYYLMNFKDALKHFQEKQDIFKYKKEYYFPFLFTGFGHYLTVKLHSFKDCNDCSGVYMSTNRRQVKLFGDFLYFENIERFIETTIECYDKGAYYEYPHGILADDVLLEDKICYQFNPDSQYWKNRQF